MSVRGRPAWRVGSGGCEVLSRLIMLLQLVVSRQKGPLCPPRWMKYDRPKVRPERVRSPPSADPDNLLSILPRGNRYRTKVARLVRSCLKCALTRSSTVGLTGFELRPP